MVKIGTKIMTNDKIRWGLTLVLGMMVLFWRVVIPANFEITAGTVVLVVLLDSVLLASVIFLNLKELKEAFARKFILKDALKVVLVFASATVIMGIMLPLIMLNLGLEQAIPPAQQSANEFQKVFPIGAFLSMAILAPIYEEIVFRMAGKNLIKNDVLFVLVTPILFAFIHTINFSLMDNLFYLIFGIFLSISYLIVMDIRVLMIMHLLWNIIGAISSFYQ